MCHGRAERSCRKIMRLPQFSGFTRDFSGFTSGSRVWQLVLLVLVLRCVFLQGTSPWFPFKTTKGYPQKETHPLVTPASPEYGLEVLLNSMALSPKRAACTVPINLGLIQRGVWTGRVKGVVQRIQGVFVLLTSDKSGGLHDFQGWYSCFMVFWCVPLTSSG